MLRTPKSQVHSTLTSTVSDEHSATEIQQRHYNVHAYPAAHTRVPLVFIFIRNRIRRYCLFCLVADNFQTTIKTVTVFHWHYEKKTTATKQHTLSSLFPFSKRKSSLHRRIFHRRGLKRRTTIITYIYYSCRRQRSNSPTFLVQTATRPFHLTNFKHFIMQTKQFEKQLMPKKMYLIYGVRKASLYFTHLQFRNCRVDTSPNLR